MDCLSCSPRVTLLMLCVYVCLFYAMHVVLIVVALTQTHTGTFCCMFISVVVFWFWFFSPCRFLFTCHRSY